MELVGLEPTTSWVRFGRATNSHRAICRAFWSLPAQVTRSECAPIAGDYREFAPDRAASGANARAGYGGPPRPPPDVTSSPFSGVKRRMSPSLEGAADLAYSEEAGPLHFPQMQERRGAEVAAADACRSPQAGVSEMVTGTCRPAGTDGPVAQDAQVCAAEGAIGNEHRREGSAPGRHLPPQCGERRPRVLEDVQRREAADGREASRREGQVTRVGVHERRWSPLQAGRSRAQASRPTGRRASRCREARR